MSSPCVGSAVRALAQTQGHDVVSFEEDGPVDLIVIDGQELHPSEIEAPGVPILVVTSRRLKSAEIVDLKRSGAARVLDRDSSVLDLAFAFSDILFGTRIEQRRYAKALGGVDVKVSISNEGPRAAGQLLGIARCGAILVTPDPIVEGTRIEMCFGVAGRSIALRGRAAYTADQHVGVEFALDDVEVAPRLEALLDEPRPSEAFGEAIVSA